LERDALERSLDYPENSAGRRMQTEFITVPPDWTVGQAIDYMRETPDIPDRFYEIYAVDAAKHWKGALPLTCCCARAGRCRWPIWSTRNAVAWPSNRRSGRGGAAVRQI